MHDEEVTDILHAAEDCIQKCQEINKEKLQRLMSPNVIDSNLEE